VSTLTLQSNFKYIDTVESVYIGVTSIDVGSGVADCDPQSLTDFPLTPKHVTLSDIARFPCDSTAFFVKILQFKFKKRARRRLRLLPP